MQLFYCEKCGLRIQKDDLDPGRARIQEGNVALCPACAVVPPTSSPAPLPVASAPAPVSSSPRTATQTTRTRRDQTGKSSNAQLPLPLIAAGGVALLVVAVFLLRGSPDSVAEKPTTEKPPAESKTAEKPTALEKTEPSKPVGTTPAVLEKADPVKVAPKTDTVVDFREGYAARRWADLKVALEKPGSEWSAALTIQEFIRTYGSTASGREAVEWSKKNMSSAPPTQANTVASYRRDFATVNPKRGWSYLWNAQGEPGRAANYRPLVWNADKQQYCGHETTFPCPQPVHYTYAAQERIHPGPGMDQGEPFDRYLIAAYTLQPGQDGQMALSVRLKRLSGSHSSLEIKVLVNDSLKGRVNGTGDEMNGPLGVLKAGDTVYVAIGPNRADGSDGSDLDFSIYKVE